MKLKLNLLENAIDSLEEGVRKYLDGEMGNSEALKFSVLHIAHFIELFFKYYVSKQHFLLIYDVADKKITNESKTINLHQAIEILGNCGLKIEKRIVIDIKELKQLRNKIEHYEFELDIGRTREIIGKLIYDIVIFDKEHINTKINERLPSDLWNTLDHLSEAYKLKIESAISEAKQIGRETFICYSCGNDTQVVSEDGQLANCTYCNESEVMEECCLDCGQSFPMSHMELWNDKHAAYICEFCKDRVNYIAMKDD
jgi:hypothetical protein